LHLRHALRYKEAVFVGAITGMTKKDGSGKKTPSRKKAPSGKKAGRAVPLRTRYCLDQVLQDINARLDDGEQITIYRICKEFHFDYPWLWKILGNKSRVIKNEYLDKLCEALNQLQSVYEVHPGNLLERDGKRFLLKKRKQA
jgi:hypothetical protein